jgi:hypothetical protein
VHDSNESKGDLNANQAVHSLENFKGTVDRGNSSFSYERNVFLTGSKILIIFSNIFCGTSNYFGKILKNSVFSSRQRQQLSWVKWWREREAGWKH